MVLAAMALLYWRTRWLAGGLAAGAVLSVLSFGIGMRILKFENKVPWSVRAKPLRLAHTNFPPSFIFGSGKIQDFSVNGAR
jgi:hypothetical protein